MLALNDAYLQHKAAGRWADAVQAGEQMLAVARSEGWPVTVEVAAIDQIAVARLNLAQFDEALALYKQVINTCRRTRGTDRAEVRQLNTVLFNGLTGAGRVHRSRDEQQPAAKYFREAIEHARNSGLVVEAAQGATDLAFSLTELGQVDQAIAELKRAIPILKQAARTGQVGDATNSNYANALHALAFTYDQIGRYDLGEPYHRRALDVIVRHFGWQHNFTATIADNLANAYHMQGRIQEAEQMYRAVAVIYESTVGREHPRRATALNNLARLLETEQRKHVEAEKLGREALRIKRAFYKPGHAEIAISLVNLANILSYQNRDSESEELAREALAMYEKANRIEHEDAAQCLQMLATCRLKRGAPAEGLALLDQALAANEKNPFPPAQTAKLHAMRALMLQQLDRQQDAAGAMDRALALVDIERSYAAGVERERAGVFEQYSIFFDSAIDARAALNDVDAMFAISESMKARAFLDELQTQHVDLTAGLPEAERRKLAARETALRRQLSQARAAVDALPELGADPTEQQLAQRREAVQALFAARDALYEHLANVKAASTTYRELIANQAETATLADLQAKLAGGELVLSYIMGESHSYVIAIRNDRAKFTELVLDEASAKILGAEPGELTRAKLTAVLLGEEGDQGGVMSVMSSPEPPAEGFTDKLAALWKTLIPAAERTRLISKEVTRLTVLPSGALSLLPLETLVVAAEAEPEYLLDVGPPVLYAPSASVMLNLTERNSPAVEGPGKVLALGDPAYPQASDEPDTVDRLMAVGRDGQPLRAPLTLLPFSGWEANWVKKHFEQAGLAATLLTGSQATEAAVRREVAGRRIVHLGCHGSADQSYRNFFGALSLVPGGGDNPADDGLLSMSEIYGLDLTGCELAILSACQTNYGPQQWGEGVWALSRGFLVAGARRVVASNWMINDLAGATLVSHFAYYLSQSGSNAFDHAAALQQAKRVVRKDDRWRHPFYWGSLVLVGPN